MRYATILGALIIFTIGCSQIHASSATDQNGTPQKKVLIVTGIDYPGHKWKLTAPVLAKAIGADKRLSVTITEDPNDLANDGLDDYDVIVLHFMNWEVPDLPAPKLVPISKPPCRTAQDWCWFISPAGRFKSGPSL